MDTTLFAAMAQVFQSLQAVTFIHPFTGDLPAIDWSHLA
jgi:hypothetical protein